MWFVAYEYACDNKYSISTAIICINIQKESSAKTHFSIATYYMLYIAECLLRGHATMHSDT